MLDSKNSGTEYGRMVACKCEKGEREIVREWFCVCERESQRERERERDSEKAKYRLKLMVFHFIFGPKFIRLEKGESELKEGRWLGKKKKMKAETKVKALRKTSVARLG